MTNTKKLEERILRSGKKKVYLAKKLGVSTNGLRRYIKNESEFKASQIQILCEELNITDLREKEEIFFA